MIMIQAKYVPKQKKIPENYKIDKLSNSTFYQINTSEKNVSFQFFSLTFIGNRKKNP